MSSKARTRSSGSSRRRFRAELFAFERVARRLAGEIVQHPEAARELWESLPGYLRKGQDFLVRVEDFVGEVTKQGSKVRSSLI